MPPAQMRHTFLILLVIACLTGAALSQTTPGDKAKAYQDQKRALKLGLLSNEIKALEDAPMRCLARTQIVKFIFDNKATSHFDTATTLAFECLDDIQNNVKEFGDGQ